MITINPRISVVIPVYNGANYLNEAIESALAQTYSNIEVIVVNDGSNDEGKTAEIAKSYGDRIIYYYKTNGGVSSAINYGLEKMKGDLFSWLSHDDLYSPYKIEQQLDFYLKYKGKVIVFSHSDIINNDGKVIIKGRNIKIKPQRLYYDILANVFFLSGCTLLIPSAAFGEVGLFSDKYKTVQDYEMWFRMINAGYQLEYLPISAVKTRVHANQDSRVKTALFIEEKNDFYIDLQNWFRSDLWLDYWDNKAIALFLMAKNYKKGRLNRAYQFSMQRGQQELLRLPLLKKLHALVVYVYVISWCRYLSPALYLSKLKLILGKIT